MADLAHYLYHRRQLNVVKNNFYRSFVQFYISYNALFVFFPSTEGVLMFDTTG